MMLLLSFVQVLLNNPINRNKSFGAVCKTTCFIVPWGIGDISWTKRDASFVSSHSIFWWSLVFDWWYSRICFIIRLWVNLKLTDLNACGWSTLTHCSCCWRRVVLFCSINLVWRCICCCVFRCVKKRCFCDRCRQSAATLLLALINNGCCCLVCISERHCIRFGCKKLITFTQCRGRLFLLYKVILLFWLLIREILEILLLRSLFFDRCVNWSAAWCHLIVVVIVDILTDSWYGIRKSCWIIEIYCAI